MITATEIRKEARNHLKNKWGKGVLITFCYFIIEMIISIIVNKTEDISIVNLIIGIAQLLISVPISFGLIISFIKLKRDEDVGAFDFITSGFGSFKKSWAIYLRMVLKMIVPIILVIISIVIITASTFVGSKTFAKEAMRADELSIYDYELEDVIAANSTYKLPNNASKAIIWIYIGAILLLASEIYAIVISLKYVLSYYIAYDEPDLYSKDVVEKSATMMIKNRGKYFVLTLSFIGWSILAVLTMGIGFLWLMPYMMVSQVCFYEALKEKDEVSIEE